MGSSGGSLEVSESIKNKLLLEEHSTISEVVEVSAIEPSLASYGFTKSQAEQVVKSINEIRLALHKMGITK